MVVAAAVVIVDVVVVDLTDQDLKIAAEVAAEVVVVVVSAEAPLVEMIVLAIGHVHNVVT